MKVAHQEGTRKECQHLPLRRPAGGAGRLDKVTSAVSSSQEVDSPPCLTRPGLTAE